MPIQQTDSGSERYYRWKQIIPLSLPLLSEPVKSAEGLILISSDPSHSPSFTRSISHLPFSSHSANLHYHTLDQRAVGWTVRFTGNLTHSHTHTHVTTLSPVSWHSSLNDRLGWDKQNACFPAKLTCINVELFLRINSLQSFKKIYWIVLLCISNEALFSNLNDANMILKV